MTPLDMLVLDLTQEVHDEIDSRKDQHVHRRAEYAAETMWKLRQVERDDLTPDQAQEIKAAKRRLLLECLNMHPGTVERFL